MGKKQLDIKDEQLKKMVQFADVIRLFYYNRNKNLQTLGISSVQMQILHYLADHEGCNQQELVDLREVSRATISNILSQMEKNNLIIRKTALNDGRKMEIHLGQSGRVLAQNLKEEFRSYCQEHLDEFSEPELNKLCMLIDKFAK